jgi:outer membrane receptor protein involved in Fe transport
MRDYQVTYAVCALAAMAPATAFAEGSPSAAPASASVEEVVVTGSRISRQDYSASTPVVTLGPSTLQKTGAVTLDTALKQQPQFVGSTGSTTNSSGNGGQANIQLRGLGRQRTLVLMDGRRLPPANSDGSVDINAVPTALIENVEIITGGASAVYGSDAVAGVVNIRMKHHFDGLEIDAQYGLAEHGDADDYKLSVAGGGDFANDRGSSVFSVEYANRKSILLSDRDFTLGASRDSVLPTGLVSFATGAPSQAAIDQVFGRYGVAPGVVKATNQFGFNADGTLFTTGQTVQNFRTPANPSLFFVSPKAVQVDGRPFRFLQLPLETYSVYSRSTYDLTADTHAFAQVLYTYGKGATQLNPLPAPSNASSAIPPVPVTNPFIPADLRTLLASRAAPTAPFALSKRFDASGARLWENTNNTLQIVGGLDGKLPVMDWTWDVSATYGRNKIDTIRTNYQSRSALQSLLSAADGGASICDGGFNPFGDRPISAACNAYINPRLRTVVDIDQRIVEANFQGGLLQLPAGELRFAAGAEYREDYFRNDPDPLTARGDIIANAGSFFEGRTEAKEAYGELLIPILKDLPLVKDLSADIGGRISDYNTIGSVGTYKADVSWKMVDSLTFRGGYERAIRAPNISELYSPVINSVSIIGLAGSLGSGDPCDIHGAYRTGPNAAQVRALCLATGVPASQIDTFTFNQQSAGTTTGGNPDLKQETADTFSVGAVWRPDLPWALVQNLSISLDYFNIDVRDAVGSITAPLTLSRCFNAAGTTNPSYDPANPFCQLTSRNADGTINLITAQSLNLGGYKTSGVDLQADWRFDTSALGLQDGGQVSVNLLTSYLDSFKIKSLPGDPFLEYAGTIGNGQIDPVAISRPRWKSNLEADYTRGPATVGVTWRYIGKMSNAANVGATVATAAGVPSVSYFDLSIRYRLNERLELWGVVANLADKQPPVYPTVGSTDLATYDVIGRRFTLGLKARF